MEREFYLSYLKTASKLRRKNDFLTYINIIGRTLLTVLNSIQYWFQTLKALMPHILKIIMYIDSLFMSGGMYGLMDWLMSQLFIVGRVMLPGLMALLCLLALHESLVSSSDLMFMELRAGFQFAAESIVTSSTSEELSVFRMPHIYWSTSRPSNCAGLLK